ncbi:MAG: hypoxanthine phosphoribosyltransferase [Clostridiales bacterium]|nr:hypoxanthine phosphoribosyltransferase [Clostridiales bacterium]
MKNMKIILTAEQIQKRVKELGEQITRDYSTSETNSKRPVVICTLKGAVYFFADLTKNINRPLMLDFARLSSYRDSTTSGKLELQHDILADITDRDVIVVEDIIDSGKTLKFFVELLKTRNPRSVKICAFLDKKERREVDIEADYVGFDIPCGFVVGYGMDYAERFRELPFLAEIIDPNDLDD